jgi:hypothetical protein
MKIKQIVEGIESSQCVAEGSLNEFAPPGSDDGDDGFSEETLKRLAAQWYNGDEDPRVERTLMAAGWEIGQDEGYDDEPGVFVVQAGDVNGNSYLSWPAHELKQGVAEGSEAQDNLVSILNSFDYYSDNGKVYVNDAGDKIARQGSNWKHQSGKVGHGSEELGNFLSSKKGVAEGQEVDVNVIVGKLYDMIDHAENQIKNADTDNQAKYATILRDRAQKALVMIKQGGHTSDTASAAYKYFLTGEKNKLEEVSLGDYHRKASLSKALSQIEKVFGPPEKKEKADSIIAKRERGLDRADARRKANAEKLKQKAEQDRIASLQADKSRLDDFKTALADLESKFDSHYEYSDDHREWTKQREIQQKIMRLKKHIADIEALDEADDNFGQPATMMKASPEAMDTANAIVQQQADKNVVSQAKIAGTVPSQGVSESGDDDSDDYVDPVEADYDEEWDAMIDRLKELAGKGPLVSIRGDDGITRNVPKKDLNK